MGCDLSKVVAAKAQNETNPQDTRLPLTSKQKFTIMASWKGVARALEQTGVHMFIRLFEENAELLEMFTQFRELRTKEQQSESTELANHAQKVMVVLDEGIRGLDDIDVFLTYLHQVGAMHTKIPGFNPQYFWKIEKPFLDAVQRTLDDRYSANVENIYKMTIKFIIETLIDGFEKAAQSGSAQSNSAKS